MQRSDGKVRVRTVALAKNGGRNANSGKLGKVPLKFEIDSTLKAKAEETFSKLGLSPEEGITLFYEQLCAKGVLPFERKKLVAKLDASWIGWLQENIARGCNTVELRDILLAKSFSPTAIKLAMGEKFPEEPANASAAGVNHRALAEKCAKRLLDRPDVKQVDTPLAQIFAIDQFMNEAECDQLTAIVNTKLRPSTVGGPSRDKYFRTSMTCDLSLMTDPFIEVIDKRICSSLGISRTFSEGIQAQKYSVGQQFKSHLDYFEPGTEDYRRFAGKDGNRTWTFMIYLNNTPKGGATAFMKLGKVFHPKKGFALAWNNLCADGSPNQNTLHAGRPVTEGEKLIVTKWFRENGTGKMLEEL
jgi:prolyl 4-hydroxylase